MYTPPEASTDTSLSAFWNSLLDPYCHAEDRKAWFQLVTTLALFALNWYLMLLSLKGPYWITVLAALPATGLLTRLFIFQHDCGHGSFFRSAKLNNRVGAVLGVITLTPYQYWRRTHAIHHATSGDLDRRTFGEVVTLTVKEYQELSTRGKIRYRVYRNPFVLLVVGPVWQFVIKHRFPWDMPKAWSKEWASVMWTNLTLVIVVTTAAFTIGLGPFLLVQLPISLIGGALGIWLFYVQHQFEDTYWREHTEWSFHRAGIEGSSYYDLPGVLHWFTGNIGFHHVHHLASRIPNYSLKKCFREVQELQGVTRLTISSSIRCARLHLWDEEKLRLVSFRNLRSGAVEA